jgi:hypothetical protein
MPAKARQMLVQRETVHLDADLGHDGCSGSGLHADYALGQRDGFFKRGQAFLNLSLDLGDGFLKASRCVPGCAPGGNDDGAVRVPLTLGARRDLPTWLNKAKTCSLEAFRRFARGLEKEYDALSAALSEPWSTGQVEGHITRLKLLKRQMYGSANIDLRRLRLLHPP